MTVHWALNMQLIASFGLHVSVFEAIFLSAGARGAVALHPLKTTPEASCCDHEVTDAQALGGCIPCMMP
jgi:hypothetical protein